MWCSTLQPNDRLIALAYADHAGGGLGRVFVTVERLIARTGLSRSTVLRCVARLRQTGWLVLVEPARQHRAPRYALRVPASSRNAEEADQRSPDDTSEPSRGVSPNTRGATVVTRGVSVTPDLSSDLLPHYLAGEIGSTPPPHASAGAGGKRREIQRWTATDVSAARIAITDAGDVPAHLLDVVLDLAMADTTTFTKPAARLAAPPYRAELVKEAHTWQAALRRSDALTTRLNHLRSTIEGAGQAGAHALREARHAMPNRDGDDLAVLFAAVQDLAEAVRTSA